MSRKLFVNLAIDDLERSAAFFGRLGFEFDPRFTDESATCMIVGGDAYCMLIVRSRFADFLAKPYCSAADCTQVVAVSAESREAVDALVDRAFEAGATPAAPTQDLGFMYGRSFCDPDGYHWEAVWVDPEADAIAAAEPAGAHAA